MGVQSIASRKPLTADAAVVAEAQSTGGFTLTERSHWSLVHAAAAVFVAVGTSLSASVMVGSLDRDFLLVMTGVMWMLLFFGCFTLMSAGVARARIDLQALYIFGVALVVRLVAVYVVGASFEAWGGTPFEPHANDSLYYHEVAVALASSANLESATRTLSAITPSNMGYVVFVALVYVVWGIDVLAVRIVQAVLGAITALVIYKTMRLTASSAVARSAGLLCALYPYLVYYTGLHLKETVLIFVIVVAWHLTVRLSVGRKGPVGNTVMLLAVMSTVFFFRTFLAVLLILSVAVHVLVQRRGFMAVGRRTAIVGSVGLVTLFVVGVAQPRLWSEVVDMVVTSAGQFERELRDKEQKMGNSIDSELASQTVFVAAAAVGPLPAVVSIPGQENSLIQYGFAWVRHSFLLFALLGLYNVVRARRRDLIVVVMSLIGYVVVIGAAGLPTSHRFQLLALPGWIVLAAIGLHAPVRRGRLLTVWLLSMLTMGVIVFTWNYLKLAVRSV